MSSQKQKTKSDRIDELIEKKRFDEAIPMLEAQIRKKPSITLYRMLANCQVEAGKYFDYFQTFQNIGEPKTQDLEFRQQVIERLIGPQQGSTLEHIECLAQLACELHREGNPEEARRIGLEAVANWFELYRLQGLAGASFPGLAAMLGAGIPSVVQDAAAPPAVCFCQAWLIRKKQVPGADYNQAFVLLQNLLSRWDAPYPYYEMAHLYFSDHHWAEAIQAYAQFLKAAPIPRRSFSPKSQVFQKISAADAAQIAQAVQAVLPISPVEKDADEKALLSVLEFGVTLLGETPFREAYTNLLAGLPEWVLDRRSLLVSCAWTDWKLDTQPRAAEVLESYLKVQLEAWPDRNELAFRMAKLYYTQGECTLALEEMRRVIELAAKQNDHRIVAYQAVQKKWERMEMISLRLPSERISYLSESEKKGLDILFQVGNFENLDIYASICGIPIRAAAEMVADFKNMKLLSVAHREETADWLPVELVYIGEEVYRLQKDVAVQLARKRGSQMFFPAPPIENSTLSPITSPVFKTGDEKRVFQALSHIFPSGDFVICVNPPVSILFDKEQAMSIIEKEAREYYFSTSLDFCIARAATGIPVLAVEVDGVTHFEEARRKDDRWKNHLFQQAGLPLLRISYPEMEIAVLEGKIRKALAEVSLLPEHLL